jgi:hypothetical protein
MAICLTHAEGFGWGLEPTQLIAVQTYSGVATKFSGIMERYYIAETRKGVRWRPLSTP